MTHPSLLLASYTVGLLGTSFMLWGNVGAARWGILPAITDKLSVSQKLSDLQKAALFGAFYERAKVEVVFTTALVSPSLAVIAYFSQADTILRPLAVASFLSFFVVLPYTLVAMMHTNKNLLDIVSSKNEVHATEKGPALLEKWKTLHTVRMGLYFVAWSTLIAGLVVRP